MNTVRIKTFFRGLVAKQLEARVQKLISQRRLKVVAVTGSVGKTSTKLAIAAVLRQKYQVLAHQGNFNSEIGLPLSIFELDVPESLFNPLDWFRIFRSIDRKLNGDYPYEVLVLEMGADQPGDIQKFMRYITPDIGIVTAIAPVHLEQFGSVDEIAYEKMALARGSKMVLLNAEDARVMKEAAKLGGPVQTYGATEGHVRFSNIGRSKSLTLNGKLHLNDGEVEVKTHFLGRHSLAAVSAAAAVGEDLGLTLAELKAGVESIEPFAGRMRVFPGKSGSMIIDDTYNASPRSVKASLDTLRELPGRHIAILGTMNELGDYSAEGHAEVGRAAQDVDVLVTIGDEAEKYLAAAASQAGLAKGKIHSYRSPYEAGEYVNSIIKKGDVILAKGSQNGVFAEEAIAQLLDNPDDKNQLVRQGADWQARKKAQFS